MKQKIVLPALVLALASCLAGCGGSAAQPSPSPTAPPVTPSQRPDPEIIPMPWETEEVPDGVVPTPGNGTPDDGATNSDVPGENPAVDDAHDVQRGAVNGAPDRIPGVIDGMTDTARNTVRGVTDDIRGMAQRFRTSQE